MLGVALVFALTGCDTGILGGEFEITGFPGYTSGESQWSVYTSTKGDHENKVGIIAGLPAGTGTLKATGIVSWKLKNPSDGQYYIYLVKSNDDILRSNNLVTISGGDGAVLYTSFSIVQNQSRDEAFVLEADEVWMRDAFTDSGTRRAYVFYEDGSAWDVRENAAADGWYALDKNGTWSTNSGKITFKFTADAISRIYDYTVAGDVLTLVQTSVGGSVTTTCTKTSGIVISD